MPAPSGPVHGERERAVVAAQHGELDDAAEHGAAAGHRDGVRVAGPGVGQGEVQVVDLEVAGQHRPGLVGRDGDLDAR